MTDYYNGSADLLKQIADLTRRIEALENPSTSLKEIGYGVVLADKNDGSKNIMVHLHEEFPTIEGDLSTQHASVTYSGVDHEGVEYKHTLQSNSGIKAIWLEEPNRLTAPNVRAGELVKIYQSGDGDKFYWSEVGRNKNLRRAEKVVYAFNASSTDLNKSDAITSLNHYTLEVNGQDGHLTLLTSKDNKEYCKHILKVDSKNGNLIIATDQGDQINLNTKNSSFLVQTKEGGKVGIVKRNIVLEGDILQANFKTINLNGNTKIMGTTEMQGTSKSDGVISCNGITNNGDINTSTINGIPTNQYKH